MPIPMPKITQEQRDRDQRSIYLLTILGTDASRIAGPAMTPVEVDRVKARARDELAVLLRKEWEL